MIRITRNRVEKTANRLLYRYVPALGTLLLSKLILFRTGEESYAYFALFASFSALVPIVDLGHTTRLMLGGGSTSRGTEAVGLGVTLCLLLSLCGVGLVAGGDRFESFAAFTLAAGVAFPLYMLSRHVYVRGGVDRFNLRSLKVYPVLVLLAVGGVYYSWPGVLPAIAGASVVVVFAPFISGLRLIDFREFPWQKALGNSFSPGTWFPASREHVGLWALATIAFVGAWSNGALLFAFGADRDLVEYDLVWRLLSVTLFSQLVLSHSLPKLADGIASTIDSPVSAYRRHMRFAGLLVVAQAVAVGLGWPLYLWFYATDISLGVLGSGLFMAVVFGLIVPGNQVLLATGQTGRLVVVFAVAAAMSVLLKIAWLDHGLTASEAFLSTGAGYSAALVAIHWSVFRKSGSREAAG